MDTLHKTNTAGLFVQAYVCLQVRREPKAAELEKGSAIIADFAAGLPHLDAALGALALANHDNFHSKRQTVQAIERVFGFAEEHLQIVDRADGRGLALLPSVPVGRGLAFNPVATFNPVVMLDKDRAEARAVRARGGEDWLVFFLCAFHAFAAMLEYVTQKVGLKNGSVLLALIFLFKYIARAQEEAEARRRWQDVVKPAIRALPDCGVHTVTVAGVRVVRPRVETIIAYFEANWMAVFWLCAWTDIARARVGLLDFAQTNNNTVPADLFTHLCL
jgi:hypothetical protein